MNKRSYRYRGFGGGYGLSHKEERAISDSSPSLFDSTAKVLAAVRLAYIAYNVAGGSFGGVGDLCTNVSGNEKNLKESLTSIIRTKDSARTTILKGAEDLTKFFNDIPKENNGFELPDDKFNDIQSYKKMVLETYKKAAKFLVEDIFSLKEETVANLKKDQLKKYCRPMSHLYSALGVFKKDEKYKQDPDTVKGRVKTYIDKHQQKKVSSSINKDNSSMKKNADKVSDNYYKDALMGLGNDSFMKAYYEGFAEEYNKKGEAPKRSYKDLMDVFKEEENIVLKSHPNSVFVADALNEGGLIENGLEQKEKIENIVKKRPSGNFR
jgi:hypothetical protein